MSRTKIYTKLLASPATQEITFPTTSDGQATDEAKRSIRLGKRLLASPEQLNKRIKFDLTEGEAIVRKKGREQALIGEGVVPLYATGHAVTFSGYFIDHPLAWMLSRQDEYQAIARQLLRIHTINTPTHVSYKFLKEEGYVPGLAPLRESTSLQAHWQDVVVKASDTLLTSAITTLAAEGIHYPEDVIALTRAALHASVEDKASWHRTDTPHTLVVRCHAILEKYLGIRDPMKSQKQEGDLAAYQRFSNVWKAIETEPSKKAKLNRALAGMLVGNRLDLANQTNTDQDSKTILDHILKNFLSEVKAIHTGKTTLYLDERAPLFEKIASLRCGSVTLAFDNAGPDFIPGVLPFALVLANEYSIHIRLAGNENPAFNDKTWYEAQEDIQRLSRGASIGEITIPVIPELSEAVRQGKIQVISTGNSSLRLDLRHVLPAFNQPTDLVIFDGQGRGLESVRCFTDTSHTRTRFARFSVPTAFIATVKDPFTTQGMAWETGKSYDPKRYDTIVAYREPTLG